jgi:hypothetical protein
MDEPRHRGNPDDKPTRAQREEFYRGSRKRAADRNGMSLADYNKYASLVGTRTHPLHKPGGLLFLAILMTLIGGFLGVLAIIEWNNHRVNVLAPIWLIALLLVGLTSWAWQMAVAEIRAAGRRKRDGITLVGEGHSTDPHYPDPGGPYS